MSESTIKYYPTYVGDDPQASEEFRRISEAIEGLSEGALIVRHKAPAEPFEGQLVYADGTNWNPGSGKGVYVYDGTTWVKL